MSWLNNITDLAGKAESLLNNIDQSAAVAISKAQLNEAPKENIESSYATDSIQQKKGGQSEAVETKTASSASRAKALTPKRDPVTSSSLKKSDDALFDFLNGPEKVSKSRSVPVTPRPNKLQTEDRKFMQRKTSVSGNLAVKEHMLPSTLEISRNSSYDSLNSKQNGRKASENGSVASDPHEMISDADVITLPTDSTASESEFEMVASLASKSDRDSPSTNSQSSSSDVTVENRLLRSEIASLHQELTQTTERHRKIKEDIQQTNRELRNQTDDLHEAMKAKNTQITALNMSLLEVKKLLELEQQTTTQLHAENERVLLDQSEGSGMHARTIEELRTRLSEVESHLAQEKSAYSNCQQEMLELRAQQARESKKVAESYQKSEMERQNEKKKCDDMASEVRSLRSSLNSAKQELVDYKQKAARILQSKERLISSLKGTTESEMTASTITSFDLEEARQERDAAKEDLHAARMEMANIRAEFQDTEQQFQQDQSMLQEEINELRRNLEDEVRAHQDAESELHRLREEERREREENARSRALTQSRLHDKDVEIDRLRNQLMLRSQSTPQESELESRLRQLTEAVIQKQSLVETLSAEKSSLYLQLERMEGQVKRLSQEGGKHVNVKVHDDDSFQGRHGMGSSPLFGYGGPEHGVVGKVRKAASILDQFSIRLGVFLKRYPPARLFVLIYMGLLHVWVMVVLLTYKPEVHDDDDFLGSIRKP